MDESPSTHPINSLSQRFLINHLSSSNQFVDELLNSIQQSLIETIPTKTAEIEEIIANFKHPFNSCSSLVNKSSKLIKLPVSVQIRENGQENKEGIYAVSVTENLGINVLEKCCRKIVSIDDDVVLVEARKFEAELECFCTIPKIAQPIELIESGSKYELVFEKKVKNYPKLTQILNQPTINKKRKFTEPLQQESHTGIKQPDIPTIPNIKMAPINDYINEGTSPIDSNYTDGSSLLSKLFSREANNSNVLPDSFNEVSTATSWVNRDLESARLLPEFNPFEIFTSSSRGCQVLEYLKAHKMEKSNKMRINFVQTIGKYFLEEIRPKLEINPTAALRRLFIDKLFTALETVVKPLPPQENFSNRMGKGYFDVYLKHQTTKSRRILPNQPQRSNTDVEEFARSIMDQSNHLAFNSHESSQSPVGQNFMKSENYGDFDQF